MIPVISGTEAVMDALEKRDRLLRRAVPLLRDEWEGVDGVFGEGGDLIRDIEELIGPDKRRT